MGRHNRSHEKRHDELVNAMAKVILYGEKYNNYVHRIIQPMVDTLSVYFRSNDPEEHRQALSVLNYTRDSIVGDPLKDPHFNNIMNLSSVLSLVLEDLTDRFFPEVTTTPPVKCYGQKRQMRESNHTNRKKTKVTDSSSPNENLIDAESVHVDLTEVPNDQSPAPSTAPSDTVTQRSASATTAPSKRTSKSSKNQEWFEVVTNAYGASRDKISPRQDARNELFNLPDIKRAGRKSMFICTHCEESHMIYREENTEQIKQCQDLNWTAPPLSSTHRSLSVHVSCPLCHIRSINAYALTKHLQCDHPGYHGKIFVCTICETSFRTALAMANHLSACPESQTKISIVESATDTPSMDDSNDSNSTIDMTIDDHNDVLVEKDKSSKLKRRVSFATPLTHHQNIAKRVSPVYNDYGLEEESIDGSDGEDDDKTAVHSGDGSTSQELGTKRVKTDDKSSTLNTLSTKNTPRKIADLTQEELDECMKSLRKNVSCRLCVEEVVFDNYMSYSNHLTHFHHKIYKVQSHKMNKPRKTNIFVCDDCGRFFRSGEGAKGHVIRAFLRGSTECVDNIRVLPQKEVNIKKKGHVEHDEAATEPDQENGDIESGAQSHQFHTTDNAADIFMEDIEDNEEQ